MIDCQSNTFLLMNIIISDISKLAIKKPERSLWIDFTLGFEDRNNSWRVTYLNSSEQNGTVNVYSDVLYVLPTKILQGSDTASGTVFQKRCSRICD